MSVHAINEKQKETERASRERLLAATEKLLGIMKDQEFIEDYTIVRKEEDNAS